MQQNPEGGTAAWYEPDGQGFAHNIFTDSFAAANGLENQAPVDGDLLFRNNGVVQQRRSGSGTTIYTPPASISAPGEVYLLQYPASIDVGDWLVRRDGTVWRWADGVINLAGQRGEGLVYLFSLAGVLEQAGRSWNGIIGDFQSWAGRARFYANFAADGTEGVELRSTSRQARAYERTGLGGFTQSDIAEWTTEHKLNGYSWIHFLIGRDRSNALTGSVRGIPSDSNDRTPRLTEAPGIIFQLPGRSDAPNTHPVAVAQWLLGQRGLAASQLSTKFGQPLTPAAFGDIVKYRYRGIFSDEESTFDIIRRLEFVAAGHLILDEAGRAWMQQLESAPDYGEITEDDLLAGVESYDPQGRGLTVNTARMALRYVDGLHPLAGDWPLPDVINSTLLALDGNTARREILGEAEGITDYFQGQWRLALHAQQLGLRGRATFRLEATPTRSRWLSLGRLSVRTSQWGTLAGYIESTTKQLDGSLQVVLMVGDALNFTPRAASDYRPLTGEIPEPLQVAAPIELPAVTFEDQPDPIGAWYLRQDNQFTKTGYRSFVKFWFSPLEREGVIIEGRWRPVATGDQTQDDIDWIDSTTTEPAGQGEAWISDVDPLADIQIQARFRDEIGQAGPWSPDPPQAVPVVRAVPAPPDLANVWSVPAQTSAFLYWPVPPEDFRPFLQHTFVEWGHGGRHGRVHADRHG